MYDHDAFLTHAINSPAGTNAAVDFLMIWVSAIGVPLLVLAVAGQWWRRGDRDHTAMCLLRAGSRFFSVLPSIR